MMVAQANSNMDLHMAFEQNLLKVYHFSDIQTAFQAVQQHFMLAYDITAWDTVYALYNQGKQQTLTLLESDDTGYPLMCLICPPSPIQK